MLNRYWKEVESGSADEKQHLREIENHADTYIEEIDKYEWKKIDSFFEQFSIVNEPDLDIIVYNSVYLDHGVSKSLKEKSDGILLYDSSNNLNYKFEEEVEEEIQYFMSIIILKDSEDWFWIDCMCYVFVAPDYYDSEIHRFYKCDQLRGLLEFLKSDEFEELSDKYLIKKS